MSNTVFNLPIVGDINRNTRTVTEQQDTALLEEALYEVFDLSEVIAVRWHQYTPYFNDGDPCVFGVHSFGVKFVDVTDDEGDYEDGFIDPDYRLVNWDYEYNPFRKVNPRLSNTSKLIFGDTSYENIKVKLDILNELSRRIQDGMHEVFLQKTFGDHAEVTATRDGFSVDYYEHD